MFKIEINTHQANPPNVSAFQFRSDVCTESATLMGSILYILQLQSFKKAKWELK